MFVVVVVLWVGHNTLISEIGRTSLKSSLATKIRFIQFLQARSQATPASVLAESYCHRSLSHSVLNEIENRKKTRHE